MKGQAPRLAIFDTFRTGGGGLTREAQRQRSIIRILGSGAGPSERTRAGMARRLAKEQGTVWKNVYSGIFGDLDGTLLPLGMVSEEGRLPLKRGPKVLQMEGVPFYRLERRGLLVALALDSGDHAGQLLESFLAGASPPEDGYARVLPGLAGTGLVRPVLERYVRAFCDGEIDELLPLDLARLGAVPPWTLEMRPGEVAALLGLPKRERDAAASFLAGVSGGGARGKVRAADRRHA